MLNIVIPMAGEGSRFKKVGYKIPKPLIDVLGKPMIEIVINNLRPSNLDHRFIFICQKSHQEIYSLGDILKSISPNCEIIFIEEATEGATCTVLKAIKLIEGSNPLMIANCDQYINASIDEYLKAWKSSNKEGFIMTMKAMDPKWSFIKFNESKIIGVIEKEVVSDEATVGIYNYIKGDDFISAANEMINKNHRVNGEFYVAPTYNNLIQKGYKVGIFNIGSVEKSAYGLGTPEDLKFFLKAKNGNNIS